MPVQKSLETYWMHYVYAALDVPMQYLGQVIIFIKPLALG